MQQDVEAESKTFTPGEDIPSTTNPMANLTAEQKDQVRAVIAAASTPEEVDRIERQLKVSGTHQTQTQTQTQTETQTQDQYHLACALVAPLQPVPVLRPPTHATRPNQPITRRA